VDDVAYQQVQLLVSVSVFYRQQLLTQYRAQIIGLRRQLDPANVGFHASLDKQHIKNVEAENVRNFNI